MAVFNIAGECLDVRLELKSLGAHHIHSALQLLR